MGKFDIGNTGEDTGTDPDDFRNSNTMGHPKPTDSKQLAKTTDRNGDVLVGDILDIIDKDPSRYRVAQALAQYIRERDQQRLSAALEITGKAFATLNGSGAHPCYCPRSEDGGCKCALKDEYLVEINAALTAALGPDNSKIEE